MGWDLEKQVAAATAYEELFVPALFRQFAPPIADAARIGPSQRVLDVACGTGVVAREALSRVGPDGAVSGLDVAPGMLAVARRLAPAVDLRQGLAGSLPWPDASFDAVVCQFGLMFFPDRGAALREMLRVLVPGGRLAVSVWGALEDTPAFAAEVELFERLAGNAAVDAMRAPFALGDRADLHRLFEEAGAASIDVTSVRATARFPSIRSLVEADLTGWLPLMGVVLEDAHRERILQEAEIVLAPYRGEDGSFEFEASAHIATGAPGALAA